MWKIQRLELRPRSDAIEGRRGKLGRVWVNVARPNGDVRSLSGRCRLLVLTILTHSFASLPALRLR